MFGEREMETTNGPPMAGGFTQTPTAVLRDSKLSIGARLLYVLVKSYARNDGFTDVTLERLSRDLGKGGSVRNVKRWMGELEKAELVNRERRRRPKGETWETTRTWLLVDVVSGQVVRRSAPINDQKPGAAHGPWNGKSAGQSQGPPVAHNIDASLDAIEIDVEPSKAPQDVVVADLEGSAPLIDSAQAPARQGGDSPAQAPSGGDAPCNCPLGFTGGNHAVNCPLGSGP